MKRKAVISISSSQLPKKDDVIEVLTPGNYFKDADFYYAEYDETEISGMQGTKTKLEIYPERLSLIREGTTNAKMEFEKNKDYKTLYNTPYGTMEIRIHTKDLTVDVNEEGGEIYIYYNMSISGQKPQNTELRINIKAN
jgi:uncharacterized beta-barrel protein YwiB (DUF1934 family)